MTPKTISPEELNANFNNVQSGAWSLIDVRDVSDYRAAHIPMAALMPSGHTEKIARRMNSDNVVVLYCKAGIRSGREAQNLSNLGRDNVYSLKGGIDSWTASGYPIESWL